MSESQLARRFLEETYGPMPRSSDEPGEETWMARFGLLVQFVMFQEEERRTRQSNFGDLRARCELLVRRWRRGGDESPHYHAAVALQEVLDETAPVGDEEPPTLTTVEQASLW